MIFIVAGLYEFFAMVEKKGINTYKYFGTAIGTIIPLSIIFRFEPTKNWELLFIVLALLFLFLMQFRRRQYSGVITDISTTLFGIVYISWFFSFLIKIRHLSGGVGLLSAILLITKLGDIGAYLVGMRFGKTPLVPHISPKKSVEGAMGGLLFSVLGALVSKALFYAYGGFALLQGGIAYLHLALLGIFFGILGQLGDLSESLIKRDCQVKDAGIIFPGLGGALDTIDSLLFSAPAFYFYISVILK
jgi:phosphatidate cytidylyltransferase